MAENRQLDMAPVGDPPAVLSVFPGIGLCFLEGPGFIGHEPRSADALVLHYCHAGLAECSGTGQRLSGGDIWIVPRQTPEVITLLSKGYAGVSLLLEPEVAQEAIRPVCVSCLGAELHLSELAAHLQSNPGRVLSGLDSLRQVFSQLFLPSPPNGFYRLKALELLLHLTTWNPNPREAQPYLDRALVERVDAIRRFLTEHLDCRMTQAQIATQFHISLTALKRTFHGTYGLTLDAYLRQQRMSKAKQLLLETELPISEVAHCVGYESHSQFTAVFRASQGLPPGDFRRRCREGMAPAK